MLADSQILDASCCLFIVDAFLSKGTDKKTLQLPGAGAGMALVQAWVQTTAQTHTEPGRVCTGPTLQLAGPAVRMGPGAVVGMWQRGCTWGCAALEVGLLALFCRVGSKCIQRLCIGRREGVIRAHTQRIQKKWCHKTRVADEPDKRDAKAREYV